MSGLVVPSAAFPWLLNLPYSSFMSTAPTVSTVATSAGVPILRHLLSPLFPALFSTSIPFSTATLAPKLINEVLPSS